MGSWGPAIFSDDTAADVRSEYRELLEDQVPDHEATLRVVERFRHLDPDEEHLLWLALAAAQSSLGRLDDEVKARALEVIDTGQGLALWREAGERELAKRTAVLKKLRIQLTAPQPPPKTVRRPWRHVTDLQPGDILSFTSESGVMMLLRVARIDDHRVGAAPILQVLDWRGRSLPRKWRMGRLKVGMHDGPGRPPLNYRVARHRKKDPDWRDMDLVPAARTPVRGEDEAAVPWAYTDWTGLRADLEQSCRHDAR